MSKCTYCGKEAPEDAIVCPIDGHSLDGVKIVGLSEQENNPGSINIKKFLVILVIILALILYHIRDVLTHDIGGFFAAFGSLVMAVGIFFALWGFPAICLGKIAKKTNTEGGGLAWIPIANIYLICKITRTSGWFTLLCLIPYACIIPAFLLLWRLPSALGVQDSSRILIMLPGINFFYLGYLAFRKESSMTEQQKTPNPEPILTQEQKELASSLPDTVSNSDTLIEYFVEGERDSASFVANLQDIIEGFKTGKLRADRVVRMTIDGNFQWTTVDDICKSLKDKI